MILICLFVIIAICSLIESATLKVYRKTFNVLFIAMSIFAVFRYGFGADYPQYSSAYSFYDGFKSIEGVLKMESHGEPGYLLIATLFKKINFSYYQVSIFFGVISMCFYYKFFKNTNYSLISLLIFYSAYFIVFPFNVLRQSVAISIFLAFALPALLEKKYLKYVVVILIGSLFHYSLLVVLILPFIFLIRFNKNTVLFILFVSIVFPLQIVFEQLGLFNRIYSLSYYNNAAGNILSLLNRTIFIIPSFLLLKSNNSDIRKLTFVTIVGYCIYLNFIDYELISSRINVYFKLIEIILIRYYIGGVKSQLNRIVFQFVLIILCAILFYKTLSTDAYYLHHWNSVPTTFKITDYTLFNDFFSE